MTLGCPLSAEQIAARLDEWLEVEFSHRNTAPPARGLAGLPASRQEFALDWVKRLSSTHTEIAFQFSQRVVQALESVDESMVESWALQALDAFDRAGLRPALDVIRNLDAFLERRQEWTSGATLEDARGVLSHFLHALSGRVLQLDEAESAYTDSQTVFLPPVLSRFSNPDDNFSLYKCTAAFLWAQTRFGTFRHPLASIAGEKTDPERFLSLFHALEALRLDACIRRELPGLHRQMTRLSALAGEAPLDPEWNEVRRSLSRREATVEDTLKLADERLGRLRPFVPRCYQGELRPRAVEVVMNERLQREKALFRLKLQDLLEEERRADTAPMQEPSFSKREATGDDEPPAGRFELMLDDKPLAPPEGVRKLMTSIVLDLGDIPDDYLVPAGPGEYDRRLLEERGPDPEEVWQGTYHVEGASLYPEWDFRRRHYRKNWCVLRECTISPQRDGFVQGTLRKYRGLVQQLRKTFEAMRGDERVLRRQPEGDDIDIDAFVDAQADAHCGLELPNRLFARRAKVDRDIAVMFMVDMSGSTKGWINEAEREALALLCEALETLGDRYGIYGFSGNTRLRCELYPIKRIDEPYDEAVRGRIAAIGPKDYTRMGVTIRHLTHLLNAVPARTKLLVTLSDGKPDDFDGYYRGDYGIEDTRQALIEARNSGVHPFCITIDQEGAAYLPHMYGPVNYTVIDKVSMLPLKLADVYRRLTT